MRELSPFMKQKVNRLETVAEELNLNGFKASVKYEKDWYIEVKTIAGNVKFISTQLTYMGDFYRAIHHVGLKLQKWGLENKIKEMRQSLKQ